MDYGLFLPFYANIAPEGGRMTEDELSHLSLILIGRTLPGQMGIRGWSGYRGIEGAEGFEGGVSVPGGAIVGRPAAVWLLLAVEVGGGGR